MNNESVAANIVKVLTSGAYKFDEGGPTKWVKQFIDEAEIRGADKMEEIVKARISEAVDKAAIAAQKDMRERASPCCAHDREKIRALPIEGG